MPDPQGDHLYVQASAAETRLRLKGFGHGVRKVHSAGRNRAVIIHTAAGRHLDELAARFADVGWSTREIDRRDSDESPVKADSPDGSPPDTAPPDSVRPTTGA
jgi:hypothetical protein